MVFENPMRVRCCSLRHVDSEWLEAGGLLIEWLPWLAAFALAELAAGWVVRLLKVLNHAEHCAI